MPSSAFQVADIGCAECKFLRRLKPALPWARELLGVDTDSDLLEDAARWTAPIFYDSLEPRQRTDLDLHLLAGSAAGWDARMDGVDAVTAIEL